MTTAASSRDLYEVLEVPRDADADALKKAYRKLAKKYHPDVCPDKEAEEKFKEASNAYQILSDAKTRATYDRYGMDGLRRGGPPNADPTRSAPPAGEPFEGFKSVQEIFTTFGDLFGDFFGQRAARSSRGADLDIRLSLAFHEAIWGVKRDIQLKRVMSCQTCNGTGATQSARVELCRSCQGKGQVNIAQGFFMVQAPCGSCQGRGKLISAPCGRCQGQGSAPETSTHTLTIPPGIQDGQTLRISGKGEYTPGGTYGDLYVQVRVTPDDRFTRQKDDVSSEVTISFARAALGGEVEIDTLDNNCHGTAILELSPGTQPGDLIVRREQGVPRLDGTGRGDHWIRFRVEVPRKLSDRQADLLRAFAEATGEDLGNKSTRPKKRKSKG